LGLAEITAIVDHNKIQSDTYVSKTADLGDLEAKFSAFGWSVSRCDGHDFHALAAALAVARADHTRPTIVIADTVKGRGVSFMEHTAMKERWYSYHSGAPSTEDYAKGVAELMQHAKSQCERLGVAVPSFVEQPRPDANITGSSPQRLVSAYGQAIVEEAAHDPNLVALDADLVSDTGLIPFSERFPDRFIECGIAEQDMVSQAAGLAAAGLLPVVHSFACFLTPRANEQIYNADCEVRRIIYVGSLAGLVPGGPGHSHQSVRDIALMGCLPNTVAIEPCCEREVAMALQWAARRNSGSTYIRLVSMPVEIPFELPAAYTLELGRGVVIADHGAGYRKLLIGYGPVLLAEAVKAASVLGRKGVGVQVVNLPWLNRFDDSWLLAAIANASHIYALDNHLVAGGQGERLAARLAELGCSVPTACLGATEVPACGLNHEVLRHHRLDAKSLIERIVEDHEAELPVPQAPDRRAQASTATVPAIETSGL
jgi:transketolase